MRSRVPRASLLPAMLLAAMLAAPGIADEPVPAATAPSPPASPQTPVKGADTHLLQAVRVVADRISDLTRVRAAVPLVGVRADAASRQAEAKARAARWLPEPTALARGRAWKDLGLGTGTAPGELVTALAADLDGIGLDAEGRRLLVDPARLGEGEGKADPSTDEASSVMLATGVAPDEVVVAHYAAHLLLDLPAWPAPPTTDALLARAALSEGGANLAALIFLFSGVELESEVVGGKLRPDDALGGRLVPESVRTSSASVASLLEFAYLDGFAQAAALVKSGEFSRLGVERKRRMTTRDVLHLDRPPADPAEIAPPQIPSGSGLEVADRDSLGEQGIITLVSLETGKDNLGMIAGDGWVGDAVFRLEAPGKPEEGATVWTSVFATEEDAKDMEYALGRCLASRFPGETVIDGSDGGKSLARGEKVYRLRRSGGRVSFRVAPPALDAKLENPSGGKASERRSPPQKK